MQIVDSWTLIHQPSVGRASLLVKEHRRTEIMHFKNATRTLICVIVMAVCNVVAGQDISGNWAGNWRSAANGHSGKISATFAQEDCATMKARFRVTFAKVIPFRYTTKLNIVSQQPGLTVMSGSRRLPLGGQFNYHITLTDECFNGSFQSRRNRGSFVMRKQ